MKIKNTNYNLRKTKISTEQCFSYLLIVIWTQYTILPYILQVFKRLPMISYYYEFAMPTIMITLLLLSAPYILKRIHPVDLIFYMVCVVVVLGTMMLCPKNGEFIHERLFKTLATGIPMYFIGVCYSHEKFKTSLYYASLASLIVSFLYQIYYVYIGRESTIYNMDTSYKLLPCIIYLIYWAIEKKKIHNYLIALFSIMICFSFGTRGPILAIIVFIGISIYFLAIYSKPLFTKLIFVCGLAAILIIVNHSNLIVGTASLLSEIFSRFGFSTRIFDFIILENITDSSGRDVLAEAIIEAIKQRPILGYGLMGDRVILGTYAHNIFLEMWCDFGVFLGTAILISIILLAISALYINRKSNNFYFILMMVCMVLVKLMLSGSFVYEKYFYLMIGICVSAIRYTKGRKQSV